MEASDEGNGGETTGRRVTRTREQWQALIDAQAASGLGIEPYCRQHGVTTSCFYRWRRFLSGVSGAASPWAGHKKRRAAGPVGFAKVRVVQDRPAPPAGQEPMRLRLAGGRELVLAASTPAARVAELLLALEARS
jgi:hypothetical protein